MKIIKILPLQKAVQTIVTVPGSKSYTNRSLLLAAISSKKVKIINPLISDDTKAMINCLKKLGIKIAVKKNTIEVLNNINSVKNQLYNLDANESGTAIRFLLALSTVIPGVKKLGGKPGLNKRPIEDLVLSLRQLGANIKYLKRHGYPPIQISSSKLNPGTIKLKGTISSQFISALLMIAPLVDEVIIVVNGDQISKPYIDMTVDIMKKFGVSVLNKNYKRYQILASRHYGVSEYTVETDYSSAAYFFSIAALTKSTLTVKNLNPNSVQADMKFLEILEDMGNKIIPGKSEITIIGKGIKPASVDMTDCPDQIQTLAILTAFANGISKISGISTLRIKETDRIFAIRAELKKMGIKTSDAKNVLTIFGGNPKPARIETYEDHRMAMSFAIAGTKLSGIEIVNPDVVNKTFPNFWRELEKITQVQKI